MGAAVFTVVAIAVGGVAFLFQRSAPDTRAETRESSKSLPRKLLNFAYVVLFLALASDAARVNLWRRVAERSMSDLSDEPEGGKWKQVLLVVAHPDDEAMFFAPTLLSLAKLQVSVHVLCLSTGNFDGLGQLRTQEMLAACPALRVPAAHVKVIDDPRIQDGMEEFWSTTAILDHVEDALNSTHYDAVISFDWDGVSGHANHRAIHRALREMHRKAQAGASPPAASVQVWQLASVSLLRKYIGILDVVPTTIATWRSASRELCFVTPELGRVWKAMSRHKSQWVWYRWLFVAFARYPYVNTLTVLD
mmetsp:Transcript_24699/g.53885  ORF Transcript_24699/g.53885 Transcript_24699/m.53885 type:complete len:306 (+) Transcript_24699:111-1028(+)